MIPPNSVLEVKNIRRSCECCENAHWEVIFQVIQGCLKSGSYHFYQQKYGYYGDPHEATTKPFAKKYGIDYTPEYAWYINHTDLDKDFSWIRIDDPPTQEGEYRTITFSHTQKDVSELRVGDKVLTLKINLDI